MRKKVDPEFECLCCDPSMLTFDPHDINTICHFTVIGTSFNLHITMLLGVK